MKKFLMLGACAAALAMPATAQTITPGDIINTVRNVYDATRPVNQQYNHGYYQNGVYYNNGVPVPAHPTYYNNAPAQYSPAYSLSSPVDVIFTNLVQGSTVPSNFTLDGYTSPYNQVDLSVRARGMGIQDPERIYTAEDMARGEVMFAASGVTTGDWLRGVRFFAGGTETHSVVMRSKSGTVRYVQAFHRTDKQ